MKMALNIVTSVVYGNFVFKNRTNKQIVILFYIGLSASRIKATIQWWVLSKYTCIVLSNASKKI